MRFLRNAPAAAASALLFALALPSHAVVYNCAVLPVDAQSPHVYPWDINNKRQIAGDSTFADGHAGAAMWKGKRSVVDLSETLQGPMWFSTARGINDKGQVVGQVNYRCGEFCEDRRALLWNSGVVSELPVFAGGHSGNAISINNKGRIVGDMGVAGVRHAVLWRDGQAIDLGALGEQPAATYSEAHFIGEDNVIVGASHPGPTTYRWHAVKWDAEGRISALGFLPGGNWAMAWSVNRAGTVVGLSNRIEHPAERTSHAAAWEGGQVFDLGSITPGAYSHAWAINDSGTVVGGEDGLGEGKALVWSSIHEPPQDLKSLVGNDCNSDRGYSLTDATSINADGTIIARGYTIERGFVGFMLTPR